MMMQGNQLILIR